jgi:hypothetical protein
MKVQQLENLPMVVILNCLAKYFEDGIMPRVLESIESNEVVLDKSVDWKWIGEGPEPRFGKLMFGSPFVTIDQKRWERVETVEETPMAKVIMNEFLEFIEMQASQLSALHIDVKGD